MGPAGEAKRSKQETCRRERVRYSVLLAPNQRHHTGNNRPQLLVARPTNTLKLPFPPIQGFQLIRQNRALDPSKSVTHDVLREIVAMLAAQRGQRR